MGEDAEAESLARAIISHADRQQMTQSQLRRTLQLAEHYALPERKNNTMEQQDYILERLLDFYGKEG